MGEILVSRNIASLNILAHDVTYYFMNTARVSESPSDGHKNSIQFTHVVGVY